MDKILSFAAHTANNNNRNNTLSLIYEGNENRKAEVELVRTNKADPILREFMKIHYSQPKGFVGRQIFYRIVFDNKTYGIIVGGSATLHLPGRTEFFKGNVPPLGSIVNNTFFHIEKGEDGYPVRNMSSLVVKLWRQRIIHDWKTQYGEEVKAFETLVEPPRTGELYLRDKWTYTGTTKGFTVKRQAGKEATEKFSGKRVWNKSPDSLRPKLVFMRLP